MFTRGSGKPSDRTETSVPYTIFDVDSVAGIRPSTARLFGAYLWRYRTTRTLLSPELFLTPINRSKAWLTAIERGEVIPTEGMVELLEQAFFENGHQLDLIDVIHTLEAQPHGSLAKKLRTDYGLPYELDALPESGAPLTGTVPIVTAIDKQDRVLILAPVLLTITLAVFCSRLISWADGGVVKIDFSIKLLSSAALIGFSAFFLGPMERLLGVSRFLRLPRSRKRMRLLQQIRESSGLAPDASGREWFAPQDEPHLLTGSRTRAWSDGLLADFAERLAPLVLFVALFATQASLSLDISPLSFAEAVLIFFTAATWGTTLAILQTAQRAGARTVHATSRGCGRVRQDVEKHDQNVLEGMKM